MKEAEVRFEINYCTVHIAWEKKICVACMDKKKKNSESSCSVNVAYIIKCE